MTKQLRHIITLLAFTTAILTHAADIRLSGAPTLISGTSNGPGMYRFPTSTVVNGTPVDLILEVTGVNNGYNDVTGSHVVWVGGTDMIQLWTSPVTCDPVAEHEGSWIDFNASIVKQGTFEPVIVEQLVLSSFDLDMGYISTFDGSWLYALDYMLVSGSDAVVFNAESKLNVTSIQRQGSNGVAYDIAFVPYVGNCIDTLADPMCNVSAIR